MSRSRRLKPLDTRAPFLRLLFPRTNPSPSSSGRLFSALSGSILPSLSARLFASHFSGTLTHSTGNACCRDSAFDGVFKRGSAFATRGGRRRVTDENGNLKGPMQSCDQRGEAIMSIFTDLSWPHVTPSELVTLSSAGRVHRNIKRDPAVNETHDCARSISVKTKKTGENDASRC